LASAAVEEPLEDGAELEEELAAGVDILDDVLAD